MTRQKPLAPFLAYLAFFYVSWGWLWVYVVYPWANQTLGNATLSYAVINIVFRSLIWLLPVFIYLPSIDREPPLEFLKLTQFWKRGLIIGLALSVLDFCGTAARRGLPDWHALYLTWNSVLSTSILIGFFEEVPFRGFILQKLQERWGFWIANAVSSILFVAAHIPGWIMLGQFTAYNVVYIFLFGSIMAIVFKYSKSLWAPIVTHSLNDFISNVVFHI
jgi:uncharacterized protein